MARSSNTNWSETQQLLQLLGRRKTLRILSVALLVTMLASVIVWSIRDSTANEQIPRNSGEHLTHVDLQSFASLARRPIEHHYFGVAQARRSVNLSSKLSERVAALLVAIGDSVVAGQPLVELDKLEHLAVLAMARAELAGAQAKLQELKRGPRDEDIAGAMAVVDERRAIAFMHQQTFERMTAASLSGAIASAELDNANYGQQASQAQYRQAQERLAALQAGTRCEQLDGQQALVEAQQARVTQLETRLAECTLRAPFDGSVQRRWVDEGELVAPMQPILTLVESQAMEVHVGLPPAVAAESFQSADQPPAIEVKIGQVPVEVKLSSLAPALDPETGTRQVVLAVTSSDDRSFASGESADVVLRRQSPLGFWVPRSALTSMSHGMWGIWMAHATPAPGIFKLEQRPVDILVQQGEWLQIQGRLSPQELFVPTGGARLSPGEFVYYQGTNRR